MQLKNPGAQIFVPDGSPVTEALQRTTHMGIGAHQDDIPIGMYHGVLECFGRSDQWFCGITVTDGAGSPRDDLYAQYSDEEMRAVRADEEKKAAYVGEYGSCLLLDYPSSAVKDAANPDVVEELKAIVNVARPRVIYTHNLGDKHDTHIAVTLRLIQALRELPAEARPEKVYGCEVWRDLDWMVDSDKVIFDVTAHENLAASLVGIYDSQVCGGKRYDLATAGRRKAHATYFASHGTDVAQAINFGMDLTPLMHDPELKVSEFFQAAVQRFADDVADRLGRVG
jgi:LmbE family N-acetylglucosaminyl deacetylase